MKNFVLRFFTFPPLVFLFVATIHIIFFIKHNLLMKYTNISLSSFGELLRTLIEKDTIFFILGMISLVISVLLALLSLYEFFKNKINPAPWNKQSAVIITKGIYGYTRNPMYLSLIIGILGIGFCFSPILLPVTLPLSFVLLNMQIKREEEFLSTNSPQYKDYSKKVPRWLACPIGKKKHLC